MASVIWLKPLQKTSSAIPPPASPLTYHIYHKGEIALTLPHVSAKVQELAAYGFTCETHALRVSKIETMEGNQLRAVHFSLNQWVYFLNAEGDVRANVVLTGYFETLEELAANIKPTPNYEFERVGDPIPKGKGQRKAIYDFGLSVYRRFEPLMKYGFIVRVNFVMARVVRGGGKADTVATRTLHRSDFDSVLEVSNV